MKKSIPHYLSLLICFCLLSYSGFSGSSTKLPGNQTVPEFHIPKSQKVSALPYKVNNSEKKYFRPIFNQSSGCCAQASAIAYMFTYEINWARNLAGNISANQYPSHYTYNLLNNGADNGSISFEGLEVAKSNGIPTLSNYGGSLSGNGLYNWMSGYAAYYNAMQNRVEDFYCIHIGEEQGLNTLKQWMYDHANGSADGGVCVFGGGNALTTKNLPAGTEEAGKYVVTENQHVSQHAMTLVGYNDSIRWDYNGDGKYTNNIDINNDGIVNMKDWEKGGFILANSAGQNWCNSGFTYIMYNAMAGKLNIDGGINENTVYIMKARASYKPTIAYKLLIQHNARNKIRITAGVSQNTNDVTPAFTQSFYAFNFQGGNKDMRGDGSNTAIEIGLDVTELLNHIQSGTSAKFFLNVESTGGTGKVQSFSLMDYTGASVIETACSQSNVNIVSGSTTRLSLTQTVTFNIPQITTTSLPAAIPNQSYLQTLTANGGTPPYKWSMELNYGNSVPSASFPNITANKLALTDEDEGTHQLTLDFDFPFYGRKYNKVLVSANGYLNFTESDFSIANNKICLFVGDMIASNSSNDGIWYEGNNSYAIFRWKIHSFVFNTQEANFALKLFPNGEIEVYYGNVASGIPFNSSLMWGIYKQNFGPATNSSLLPQNYKVKLSRPSYPEGMNLSETGVFSGTPLSSPLAWNVTFVVTDAKGLRNKKTIPFQTNAIEEATTAVSLFNAYPIPAQGQVNIQLQLPTDAKLEVSDAMGRVLLSKSIAKEETLVTLDTHLYADGVYYFKLLVNGRVETKKVLFQQ